MFLTTSIIWGGFLYVIMYKLLLFDLNIVHLVKINIMKFIHGYQNTKRNNEDIAITPYLFGVYVSDSKIYGLGLCWLYHSYFIAIGFNIPNSVKKSFFILNK